MKLRKERVWSVWREGGWGRAAPTQHRGWEADRSWQWGLETVPEDADACRCSEMQGGGGPETVSLLCRLRTEKRPLALIRKR